MYNTMDWVLSTIIFIVVLFVYIHVVNHLSTSNDLDVYNVLNIPSDKLEELCGSKQPFVAKNASNPLHGVIHGSLGKMTEFSIRTTGNNIDNDIPPLTVGRDKAEKLFSGKKEGDDGIKYYSCGNWLAAGEALDAPGLGSDRDAFFAPPMTVFSKSDFIVGETGAHTALRHEIAHRTFLYGFNSGSEVILFPPSSSSSMDVVKDYELLEFRSQMDPWLNNEKGLNVKLEPGDTLYIPPYWFYSVKLGEHSKVHLFQYYTAFNLISTVNHHVIHMLQLNNIKMGYDSKNPIDFGESNVSSVVNEKKKKKKKKVEFSNEIIKHEDKNN